MLGGISPERTGQAPGLLAARDLAAGSCDAHH